MKAKGLLVGYNGYPNMLNFLMPDNGLAGLAGALISAGHDVEVWDCETASFIDRSFSPPMRELAREACRCSANPREHTGQVVLLRELDRVHRDRQRQIQMEIADRIVSKVNTEGISFVGFKLWEPPGLGGAVRMAEHIRRSCPGVRLYAGGPHADLYADGLVHRESPFDAVVDGQGEEAIVRLAEHSIGRCTLRDIPNLVFRDVHGMHRTTRQWVEDLDTMPLPDYDPGVYPAMEARMEKIKVITYDESRGCPNQCGFCIHPRRSGSVLRRKSQLHIRDELETLHGRHGFAAFRLAGSSSPLDLLLNMPLNCRFRFATFLHGGDAAIAHLPAARKNGCHAVFIGLETANDKLRREQLGKEVSLHQVRTAILQAKAAGIYTCVSIITPVPGETRDTMEETLEFLLDVRPDSVIVMTPRLLPFTAWYSKTAEFGFTFYCRDPYPELMDYEVPRLLPPHLAQPLPYRLDGKTYGTRMREAMWMAERLEEGGIALGISDDEALLASLAGWGGRERQFHTTVASALLTGESDVLREVVDRINESAVVPPAVDRNSSDTYGGSVQVSRSPMYVAGEGRA